MPASQFPSAGSSATDQSQNWGRELNRDRLMARRRLEVEAAKRQGVSPMNDIRSMPTLSLPDRRGGEGNERDGQTAVRDSDGGAGQTNRNSVKAGAAVAQGLVTGGVAGAAAQGAKELATQAMEQGAEAVYKSTVFKAALLAMWMDLGSMVLVNAYMVMASFNVAGTVPLTSTERLLILMRDLLFAIELGLIFVILMAAACPFMSSCPFSSTDLLGNVVSSVF